MARFLSTGDPGFEADFAAFLKEKRDAAADVSGAVRPILDAVKAHGDAALIEASERFDRIRLTPQTLRVSRAEIEAASARLDRNTRQALMLAAERIRSHHARQRPADDRYTDPLGVELGHRWTAVEAAGLYVPGGTAAYPSSVLMNAIPAKVAGVDRLVMVAPTPDGRMNDAVLAAADIAGVDAVYRIGGAQAVAALAYGTETIAPVDIIVGPGNAYVAEAKRQVFGLVGIDMIAGPSEVLIVADGTARAAYVAADLLAQAEHDTAAQSILIVLDPELGPAVAAEVERQLQDLPRAAIAGKSWQEHGMIITAGSTDQAMRLANRIAPEHLELHLADPEDALAQVRNAGAVFIGAATPEAIGDYVGGSNHVLPTSRSARFSSGLSVLTFMKRTTLLKVPEAALPAIGPAAVELARVEGLDAHGRSVVLRLQEGDKG